jgi:hypothetical protein
MGGDEFATRKSAEAAMPLAMGRMRRFLLDIAQAAVHIYGQKARYADPDYLFSRKQSLGGTYSCASCNHPTGRNRAAFRMG